MVKTKTLRRFWLYSVKFSLKFYVWLNLDKKIHSEIFINSYWRSDELKKETNSCLKNFFEFVKKTGVRRPLYRLDDSFGGFGNTFFVVRSAP